MVYFRNWDEFVAESHKLYEASPAKTRYCTKWRHEIGLLVLKVTDNSKCLKFKTRSAIYLNRFDTFTRKMIESMQNMKKQQQKIVGTERETVDKPSVGTEGVKKDVASTSTRVTGTGKDTEKLPPPPPGSKKKKGKKKK